MALCEAVFIMMLQNGDTFESFGNGQDGYNQCVAIARRDEKAMKADNSKTKFFKNIWFEDCRCSGSVGKKSTTRRGGK